MKKVNFKITLMGLLLAVAFLFAGGEQAKAQTLSSIGGNGLYAVPQGNFVGSSEALVLIEGKMEQIKIDMLQFAPGSSFYIAYEREYLYYQTIHDNIKQGVVVPQAIITGILLFDSADAYSNVTQQTKQQLKNDAVDLLSN